MGAVPYIMLWRLIFMFSISTLVGCHSTKENDPTPDKPISCEESFTNNGLNYSTFHQGVAHGIHSLSLEEIRYFFKPDAPENNKIPTANIDFRSEDLINFNAPLWGYEDRFDTWALKIMDWFMLNDKPYILMKGTSTVEKIAHQYHMQEIYTSASKMYQDLVLNPPVDPKVCSCSNDVTANGVLDEVKTYKGRKTRFIFYGRKKRSTNEDTLNQLQKAYLRNSNKQTALDLISEDPWIPGKLDGPKQWISYSGVLTFAMPTEEKLKDFATFIYCKLNQPTLDHPKDLFKHEGGVIIAHR